MLRRAASTFRRSPSTSYDPATIGKVERVRQSASCARARGASAETTVASIKDHIRVRRDRLRAIDEWLAHRS